MFNFYLFTDTVFAMFTPKKQKYKKHLLRDYDSRFFLTLKEQ